MKRLAMSLLALLMCTVSVSGCALVAGGVAGGVAGSEIAEDDGRFDPFENTEVGREVYD